MTCFSTETFISPIIGFSQEIRFEVVQNLLSYDPLNIRSGIIAY